MRNVVAVCDRCFDTIEVVHPEGGNCTTTYVEIRPTCERGVDRFELCQRCIRELRTWLGADHRV
jgi:hypothetical protein